MKRIGRLYRLDKPVIVEKRIGRLYPYRLAVSIHGYKGEDKDKE